MPLANLNVEAFQNYKKLWKWNKNKPFMKNISSCGCQDHSQWKYRARVLTGKSGVCFPSPDPQSQTHLPVESRQCRAHIWHSPPLEDVNALLSTFYHCQRQSFIIKTCSCNEDTKEHRKASKNSQKSQHLREFKTWQKKKLAGLGCKENVSVGQIKAL